MDRPAPAESDRRSGDEPVDANPIGGRSPIDAAARDGRSIGAGGIRAAVRAIASADA